MYFRKYLIVIALLLLANAGTAQITSFVGARAYPSYGKTRVYDGSMALGYGAGITYVFWEYNNWFIKTGADFLSRTSTIQDIPRYYEVPRGLELVRTDVLYKQQDISVPIYIYYLPWEKKGNAILVVGGMDVMYTIQTNYEHDTFGSVSFDGADIDNKVKAGFTLGAGYQRELTDIMFLNVYPTINLDIRSDKPFTSFGLTLEWIYGIY